MIAAVRSQSLTIPPFFFVDPYGYPLPVPMLRRLLTLPKAEVLVNLMWYRINMDLGKTLAWDRIDALFGHNDWILQNFDEMNGSARERTFIDYFQKEVGAPFHVPFPMTYSPEDHVSSPAKRHKYYLIHFSRHHAAPLAMKKVLYRARGELDTSCSDKPAVVRI